LLFARFYTGEYRPAGNLPVFNNKPLNRIHGFFDDKPVVGVSIYHRIRNRLHGLYNVSVENELSAIKAM
jgi:hypothetical protein